MKATRRFFLLAPTPLQEIFAPRWCISFDHSAASLASSSPILLVRCDTSPVCPCVDAYPDKGVKPTQISFPC